MLGTFWPPGFVPGPVLQQIPEEAVAGQFTRRNEGRWQLALIGSLLPSDHSSQHDPNEPVPNYDVIFGASRNSTCLSLFGAWRSSYSLFSALQDRETWDVGWYAEGDGWIEPDDEVHSIAVEYDLLSDWGWPQHQPTHGYSHQDQTFSVPPTKTITIEALDAQIDFRFGWDQTLASHQYLARAQSLITIHDRLPLSKVRDKWVAPIQVLLEFLTLHYVHVKKVVVRPSDIDARVQIHYDVHKPSDLDDRSDQGVHPNKMLATRSHLASRGIELDQLFRNYFALIGNVDHEFALWFLKESHQRLIDRTVDTSLLNAFRALERYHDVAINDTAIPQEDHDARVAAIVDNTPDEHREWARDRLSGANKKGLRRQLDEVCTRSCGTEAKILSAWPGFFDSIVNLRSKVAHGIPETSDEAALRYLSAARGLQWILRHAYLRELGLADSDAAATVSTCLAFEQDLGRLKDWRSQLGHVIQ